MPPLIVFDDEVVQLTSARSTEPLPQQVVNVTNGGTGTLDAIVITNIPGWLTAVVGGVGNAQTITIDIIDGDLIGYITVDLRVTVPNAVPDFALLNVQYTGTDACALSAPWLKEPFEKEVREADKAVRDIIALTETINKQAGPDLDAVVAEIAAFSAAILPTPVVDLNFLIATLADPIATAAMSLTGGETSEELIVLVREQFKAFATSFRDDFRKFLNGLPTKDRNIARDIEAYQRSLELIGMDDVKLADIRARAESVDTVCPGFFDTGPFADFIELLDDTEFSLTGIYPDDLEAGVLAGTEAFAEVDDKAADWNAPIVTAAPPDITSIPATIANDGVLYEYFIVATGDPAPTFGVTGLPPFLTFDGANRIFGTPATGDVCNTFGPIDITATNGVTPDDTQQYFVSVFA